MSCRRSSGKAIFSQREGVGAMKKVWAFVGSMGGVIVLAVAVAFWWGPATSTAKVEGVAVKKEAEEIGLRADVSDRPVTLDGKPLKGTKKLMVLGDALFLNHHQIFPARQTSRPADWDDWDCYAECIGDETEYLYGYMTARQGRGHRAALEAVHSYLQDLPDLQVSPGPMASGATAIVTRFGDNTNARYTLAFGIPYSEDYLNWMDEKADARRQAREQFGGIISSLENGKKLKVVPGKKYGLE